MESTKPFADSMTKVMEAFLRENEDVIERSLRTCAVPPIKGPITKWKIQWRGIFMVHVGTTNRGYLSQRGKRISPDFMVTPINQDNAKV